MSEEQKQVVWDAARACFWLLASLIWAQIVYAFMLTGFCAYGVLVGTTPPGLCKEFAPNIMELLVGGLAVVLAFSGRAK